MIRLVKNQTVALDNLEIRVCENGSHAMSLALTGDIDISNANSLLGVMRRETKDFAPDVTFDLSGVDFIDSHGMRALIEMKKCAVRSGSMLRIVLGENRKIRRVFDIAGLDRILTLV